MGFTLVISLPLILFSLILGFGCYFLGRARGRKEVLRGAAQGRVVPTRPPGTIVPTDHPSPPKEEDHVKKVENSMV